MTTCDLGYDWTHVWCRPCRVARFCLRLPPLTGPDIFTPQPLTGEPLTVPQQVAIDLLQHHRAQTNELCDRYSTMLALWRKGLVYCDEQSPHLSRMTDHWQLCDPHQPDTAR